MRIVWATGIALCLSCTAMAAPASDAAPPEFVGFFVRVGDLWFDPILDDDGGKPVERLDVKGPDAENIWAGDYDNPILQPWSHDAVKANAQSEMALQHVYTADDSCWPSGVPQAVNLLDEVQFIQTKDRVTILYRRDHQVRRIYLNVSHTRKVKPSWYGESVGHYEGDTLVVDTVGLKAHKMSVVDPFGTPHTEALHVVERYRPFATPFGTGIEVTVEVDDPGAFTRSWKGTAEYRQDKSVTQFDEMVCAENNRSFAEGSTFGTLPVAMAPQF